MVIRLTRWLIFGVAVALLPIAFRAIVATSNGQTLSKPLLLSHGELLIVASAVAARGIGELLGRSGTDRVLALLAGGGAFITASFSSLYFALAATGQTTKPEIVANHSIALFLIALVASGMCVALAPQPTSG